MFFYQKPDNNNVFNKNRIFKKALFLEQSFYQACLFLYSLSLDTQCLTFADYCMIKVTTLFLKLSCAKTIYMKIEKSVNRIRLIPSWGHVMHMLVNREGTW